MTLDLNDYEIKIAEFDKYQETSKPHIYFLGLGGEFGEMMEKVHTIESDKEITKEIWDVIWYLTRIASDYGFSLAELYMENRKPKDIKTISGAIGQILEYMKKVIRDKEGIKVMRDPLLKERLLDALYLLDKKCNLFGNTLEMTVEINYNKLKSRFDRGVVSGSGDNR